jgi:hypothetical protein
VKSSVASKLVEHQWEEVAERNRFYPALRRVLATDPLDLSAVLECIENLGNTLLGGHISFRSRVIDFFTSADRVFGDGGCDLLEDSRPLAIGCRHALRLILRRS